uniref:Protein kinase domain-containing protein n=1 Tax=Rhabditophanes sp. KR3021 TaxID=114890 RepID=A0AC35TVH5_9BILA
MVHSHTPSRFNLSDQASQELKAAGYVIQETYCAVGKAHIKAISLKDELECYKVLIFKDSDYHHYKAVSARILSSKCSLTQKEDLIEMLIPKGTKLLDIPSTRQHCLLTPISADPTNCPISLHQYFHSILFTLSEREIRSIFVKIARLVQFCHESGIMMRCMQLKKFEFSDKECLKLRMTDILETYLCPDYEQDFILEKIVVPHFVAPEVITTKDKPYHGKQADMWGLGVLLFVVLTFQYPFHGCSIKAILSRIVSAKYIVPRHVKLSTAVCDLIGSLLILKPEQRFTITDLMTSQWMRAPASAIPNCPVMNMETSNFISRSRTTSNNDKSKDETDQFSRQSSVSPRLSEMSPQSSPDRVSPTNISSDMFCRDGETSEDLTIKDYSVVLVSCDDDHCVPSNDYESHPPPTKRSKYC